MMKFMFELDTMIKRYVPGVLALPVMLLWFLIMLVLVVCAYLLMFLCTLFIYLILPYYSAKDAIEDFWS